MGFLMKTSCNSQGYYKEEGENLSVDENPIKILGNSTSPRK